MAKIFRKHFKPFPLLSGLHSQTIFGSLWNVHSNVDAQTEYIPLPDGDKMALEVTTPPGWRETDPTVVLVHGLCGSHKSFYMVRMSKKVSAKGMKAVRINLRGCGSGKGLARNIYHCGASGDILSVIDYLKAKAPLSPIHLIGFSLGGNLVLKLGGELREHGPDYISHLIAVSPPINLVSSMRLLCHPRNRMYERYFLRHLLDAVYELHKMFPDLPPANLPQKLTVFDFDELYVAPRLGYRSAFEYYKDSSSMHKIPEIAVPCKILLSEDDPIIDHNDINHIDLPDNIEVYKTDRGGHMGYLGFPGREFRWLDRVLMSWIQGLD